LEPLIGAFFTKGQAGQLFVETFLIVRIAGMRSPAGQIEDAFPSPISAYISSHGYYARQRTDLLSPNGYSGDWSCSEARNHRPAIREFNPYKGNTLMNNIVYIVGAVVIILAVVGFLGLR
jgi:hypothetical protein